MLAGPMDFTPGIFDLTLQRGTGQPRRLDEPRPRTTLAKQLALYVVLYSPLQMAADLPENYEKRPDAFQFIRDVPTDWENTRTLQAVIGDYVVIARQQRSGRDWYLGAITDENARQLDIPLDFLAPGQRYEARIYRDAEDADYLTNPTALVVETRRVTSTDHLAASLARAGGLAVRFRAL